MQGNINGRPYQDTLFCFRVLHWIFPKASQKERTDGNLIMKPQYDAGWHFRALNQIYLTMSSIKDLMRNF